MRYGTARTRTRSTTATAVAAVITLACGAQGAVIFHDTFSTDPAANGWTESVTGDRAVNSPIQPNAANTAAMLIKNGNGAQTYIFLSITRAISTIGYEAITLDLTAYQNSTSHHGRFDANGEPDGNLCDRLQIEYSIDGGVTFAPLLTDYATWHGVNETPVPNANWFGPGNTTPTATGPLALPASAKNNGDFMVRIAVTVAHHLEGYYLDDLVIAGTAIPEPASLALVALGGLTLIGSRRHGEAATRA
jgi:hypothetical protein